MPNYLAANLAAASGSSLSWAHLGAARSADQALEAYLSDPKHSEGGWQTSLRQGRTLRIVVGRSSSNDSVLVDIMTLTLFEVAPPEQPAFKIKRCLLPS